MSCAARIVSTAPMGSTMPDRTPPANALPLLCPSARNGMEMIAPSGMFWMAMPRDKTSALAAVICSLPARKPAYMTPTAIPSGMLCRVTASTIIVVWPSLVFGPSACSLPTCRWGIRWSRASKNRTPIQNPTNAGKKAILPMGADCSMAGISRLQMEAATITPAAKPTSARCTRLPRDFFIQSTQAAPSVVPKKGIKNPRNASMCLTAECLCRLVFLRVAPRGGRPALVWRPSLPAVRNLQCTSGINDS